MLPIFNINQQIQGKIEECNGDDDNNNENDIIVIQTRSVLPSHLFQLRWSSIDIVVNNNDNDLLIDFLNHSNNDI